MLILENYHDRPTMALVGAPREAQKQHFLKFDRVQLLRKHYSTLKYRREPKLFILENRNIIIVEIEKIQKISTLVSYKLPHRHPKFPIKFFQSLCNVSMFKNESTTNIVKTTT